MAGKWEKENCRWAVLRAESETQTSRLIPEKYESELGFSDFFWLLQLL